MFRGSGRRSRDGTVIAQETAIMSAPGSKPAVPRPSLRKSSAPPPAPTVAPSVAPPVIRDRVPTLELEDDDLVEAEPVVRPRSSPPPPPPVRSTIVPKLQGVTVPKIAPLTAPTIDLPMPHTLTLLAAVTVESSVRVSVPPSVPPPPVSASVPPPAPVAVAVAVAAPPMPMPMPMPMAVPVLVPVPAEPVSRVEMKRARLESVLDPTEVLFEGMYELELVDSSWEAARVCAALLARALGARAVIVHSHDLAQRELRTIGVHGDRHGALLGSSDPSDDDLVASAVICNEKPVTMRFDGELPRLAPRRLEILGAPRTLVAVPAMAWGRCVAIIEVIDADDRFAGRVADSASYVAERLAAYLSGRLAA
jgi:hypothetical protein